ncbi:MAG: ABC transporter substrate-binding protein, partial [Patescibacteria group bacterium]|nr:ABC transporter substrate-binding protein [Patescibacteria group bacterium]
MIILRRRLLFWLIKAYIKRWRKTIFFSFGLGLIFFFILITVSRFIIPKIPMGKKERIGVVGAYSLNNLPLFILKDISTGLTTILDNGNVKPGIAKNWEIKDGGKTYIFNLNTNLYFNDGKNIDSYSIQYNFSDAKIERPEKYKIIFKLKESFSPFLSTFVFW